MEESNRGQKCGLDVNESDIVNEERESLDCAPVSDWLFKYKLTDDWTNVDT